MKFNSDYIYQKKQLVIPYLLEMNSTSPVDSSAEEIYQEMSFKANNI